jgi:hypothetical protein
MPITIGQSFGGQPNSVQACDRFIAAQLTANERDGRLISDDRRSSLVAQAAALGMTEESIDACLQKNKIRTTCDSFIGYVRGQLTAEERAEKRITVQKRAELVAQANGLGMTEASIDACIRRNGYVVQAPSAPSAPSAPAGQPANYVPIAVPITMHDAQRWNGKMYKKLGFMALAKSQGKMHKVESYLKSIDDLIASINARIAGIQDEEKKRDLNTTLDRAKLLHGFAQKLLA